MKKLWKKITALFVTLVFVLTLMPADVVKAEYQGTETGTITIANVTNDDKFVGYKILEIKYDKNTNAVTYEWASANIATAIGVTPEEFAAIDSSVEKSEERQKLLVKVANLVKTDNLKDIALDEVTASEGVATFSNVPIGGYLIVPTSTDEVYQTMMAVVQPELNAAGTDYETKSATLTAKRTALDITKIANSETTGVTKKVTYTIIAEVPTYPDDAKDKHYKISDALAGLDYVSGSIEVTGLTGRDAETGELLGSETAMNSEYTFEKTDSKNFSLEFDYGIIAKYGAIKIEYQAEIDEATAKVGVPETGKTNNPNKATLQYSHYPYVDEEYSTTEDVVDVHTFNLEIKKVDATDNDKTLSGAAFTLYRLAEDGETGVIDGTSVNGLEESEKYIKVADVTTGDDGIATINYLAEGDYYLVETKAPSGYTLPNTASTITISRTSTSMTQATGIQTATITNSSSFTLPQTGGTGTLIFTIAGVLLMLGAVVMFFAMKRKEAKK